MSGKGIVVHFITDVLHFSQILAGKLRKYSFYSDIEQDLKFCYHSNSDF